MVLICGLNACKYCVLLRKQDFRGKLLLNFLFNFSAICSGLAMSCVVNATTLYFMGLSGEDWHLYRAKMDQFHQAITDFSKVDGFQNARDFSVAPGAETAALVDAEGYLHLRNFATGDSVPLNLGESGDRFTQLNFSTASDLWVVHLPAGNSRQTYVSVVNVQQQSIKRVVSRRGAQFDPTYAEPYVYFSAAHCVDDCDPMIWEVWRRDLRTAKMQQISLGDAVSRAPVPAGDSLYFISNRSGHYHLWHMPAQPGAAAKQVTQGEVTDSDPVTAGSAGLFFIRKTASTTGLYRLSSNGTLTAIALPNDITDLRGLEAQ